MRSLLALHGAGSGPWMYECWEDAVAPDLQAGLNVAEASMLNYEAAAVRAAEALPRPLVLAGWGMGGLVALMAARRVGPERLVLLDPCPPGEVRGFDAEVAFAEGTYEPTSVPDGIRTRPESLRARSERARGIAVPEVACPVLVVCSEERAEACGRVAERFGAQVVRLEGAGHWDLVRDARALAAARARPQPAAARSASARAADGVAPSER